MLGLMAAGEMVAQQALFDNFVRTELRLEVSEVEQELRTDRNQRRAIMRRFREFQQARGEERKHADSKRKEEEAMVRRREEERRRREKVEEEVSKL